MRFSRWLFLLAGIYGLVALVPMYFMESMISDQEPPAITHPEFFYGFIGVAVAWQVAFLIISTDPPRYRPLLVAAVLEKLSFGVAVLVLRLQDRVSASMVFAGCTDLLLAALFTSSYVMLRRLAPPGRSRGQVIPETTP